MSTQRHTRILSIVLCSVLCLALLIDICVYSLGLANINSWSDFVTANATWSTPTFDIVLPSISFHQPRHVAPLTTSFLRRIVQIYHFVACCIADIFAIACLVVCVIFVFHELKRRIDRRMRSTYERYRTFWDNMNDSIVSRLDPSIGLIDHIVWPCRSGRYNDLRTTHDICRFFLFAALQTDEPPARFFRRQSLLWHPDRFQRRFSRFRGLQEQETIQEMATQIHQALSEMREQQEQLDATF